MYQTCLIAVAAESKPTICIIGGGPGGTRYSRHKWSGGTSVSVIDGPGGPFIPETDGPGGPLMRGTVSSMTDLFVG